jgi:hypothetical protein
MSLRMDTAPATPAGPASLAARALRSPALFPNHYCWYLLVCALDLALTNTVITRFGATEVNALAHAAIETAGFWGLIALKFATVLVVIGVIELVGRRRLATALRLAEWSIVLSGIPVVATLAQLSFHEG